jgi:hypothetical protein
MTTKLLDAAKALATEFTQRPPRRCPSFADRWDSLDNSYEEQLELEAELQSLMRKTDFARACWRFPREKRLPVFQRRLNP